MRRIDERAIKAHADLRFRSEYDYALFEYYRSAKVIAFLERAGIRIHGRILDAGCGGGGMPLSLAEEAEFVVGIDPGADDADRERLLGSLVRIRDGWPAAPPVQTSSLDDLARLIRVSVGSRARLASAIPLKGSLEVVASRKTADVGIAAR